MRSLAIFVLAIGLIACSKSDDKKGGDETEGAETEEGAPAAPAEPYEGPVDKARLDQANQGVKPFMKWDAAEAHLLSTVGKPHEIDGKDHNWYVLDGDKCHVLSVENAGGEVGATGIGTYDKMMKSQYEKCVKFGGGGGDEAAEGEGEGDEAAEGEGDDEGTPAAAKDDEQGGEDEEDGEGGW